VGVHPLEDLPNDGGYDGFDASEPYLFFASVPKQRFLMPERGVLFAPFYGPVEDVKLEQEQIKGLVAAARLLIEILTRPERRRGHLADPWNMAVCFDLAMTLYGIARIRLANLIELKKAGENQPLRPRLPSSSRGSSKQGSGP
jgi:hypothetical protein